MNLNIKADVHAIGMPFNHFWSVCVGAGRANEGLRAGWLEQLKLAHEQCGFEYLRFHGLFYDDMFVYRKIKGEAGYSKAETTEVYNWQYIDELFDRMLDIGVRPFVEFGPAPEDMSDKKSRLYWDDYMFLWPNDFAKWSELVTKAVTHWLDRYGVDEVRKWYFEVWNEPNLNAFGGGGKSKYFELYKTTALAVKKIDPALRIGGPSTSNFVSDARFDGEEEDVSKHVPLEGDEIDKAEWKAVWFDDFIRFCHKEGLPVDFVSTHPYPTNFALDGYDNHKEYSRSINAAKNDLTWLRRFVDNSPYPNAEIHLTEWSSSPCSRDHSHDLLPAAAFVIKTNLDSLRLADSLSYWTFTDVFEELGGGPSVFHGGFGMINYQGIVKPSFHAYRFLHLLGDTELAREDGCIVTKSSETGKVSALLYNYPEKEVPISVPVSRDTADIAESIERTGSSSHIKLSLTGCGPSRRFLMETLDKDHGYAERAWIQMGSPEPPSREQTALLKEIGLNLKKEILTADENGTLNIDLTVPAWTVVSVREF